MLQKNVTIARYCDRDQTKLQKRDRSKTFLTTHCDRQSTNFLNAATADRLSNKLTLSLLCNAIEFIPTGLDLHSRYQIQEKFHSRRKNYDSK